MFGKPPQSPYSMGTFSNAFISGPTSAATPQPQDTRLLQSNDPFQTQPVQQPQQPPGTYLPGTVLQLSKFRVFIEKYLAEGGYAHVYLVQTSHSGSPCVMKRVGCMDSIQLTSIQQEIEIHRSITSHKNIVRFLDHDIRPIPGSSGAEVYIFMEYCRGGHLVSYMNNRLNTRLREEEILRIFSDVCEGIAHLQSQPKPIVHRDIKIENILIGDDTMFKLCDFGSATTRIIPPKTALQPQEIRQLDEEISKVTTLQYRAPEMCDLFQRLGLTEKTDIWALGVLLYKLCFYTTPFEEGGKLAILNVKYTFPSQQPYSAKLIQLIECMLVAEVARRPSIWQVFKTVCDLRGTPFPFNEQLAETLKKDKMTRLGQSDAKMGSLTALIEPPSSTPVITPMRRGRPNKSSLRDASHGSSLLDLSSTDLPTSDSGPQSANPASPFSKNATQSTFPVSLFEQSQTSFLNSSVHDPISAAFSLSRSSTDQRPSVTSSNTRPSMINGAELITPLTTEPSPISRHASAKGVDQERLSAAFGGFGITQSYPEYQTSSHLSGQYGGTPLMNGHYLNSIPQTPSLAGSSQVARPFSSAQHSFQSPQVMYPPVSAGSLHLSSSLNMNGNTGFGSQYGQMAPSVSFPNNNSNAGTPLMGGTTDLSLAAAFLPRPTSSNGSAVPTIPPPKPPRGRKSATNATPTSF